MMMNKCRLSGKQQISLIAITMTMAGILGYYFVYNDNRILQHQTSQNFYNEVARDYVSNRYVKSEIQHRKIHVRKQKEYNVVKTNVDTGPLDFVYSAKNVSMYTNGIHKEAEKYVGIGSGPCTGRLPQCLIIGNFKCGTRELIDFMSMHPKIKILSEPMYEVNFFTTEYYRGLDWYKRIMPCSFSNQITVVKAPSYLQSIVAPGRIHEMNSTIKLIVLVREPVSRTLSQFTFIPGRMETYNNSLKVAMIDEQSGKVNKSSYFIKHSIYDEGMERYLQYFSPRQIKIIDSADFKNDPYAVLHDLEEFLSLEHLIHRDNFVFNKDKGHHCIRKNLDSNKAACYASHRGRNNSHVLSSIQDSPDIVKKLHKFFKPHNENFYRMVGRTFDW